jgi:SOS response regulatory protein OraA/RecX
VDGRPWRSVPDDVVVRCQLAAGVVLDRPLLRLIRSELRRAEALAVAGRALRRRDLSLARLTDRLERAGVAAGTASQAVASLAAAGAVDDARLAHARAQALAARGWGDEAVRERLESEGIGAAEAATALEALAPERERAAVLVEQVGDARKAWALLARRGFDLETIEAVAPAVDDGDARGLG